MRPCIRVTDLRKESPGGALRFPSGSRLRRVPGRQAPTPADPAAPGAGSAETARRALPPRTSPLGAGRASHSTPAPTGGELRSASLWTRRGTGPGAGGRAGKEGREAAAAAR